jgi:membrane-associated protease RseP (regulator of RpoE activity)
MNHPYRESALVPSGPASEGNGLHACLVCGARAWWARVRWRRLLVTAGVLALAAGNVAWAALACSYARMADAVMAMERHPSLVVMPRDPLVRPAAAAPAAFPRRAPPLPPLSPLPPRPPSPADRARFGVVKLSRSAYVVERAIVDDLLEEGSDLHSRIRVLPLLADGKPAGMSVYGIDPDSLVARLGLQNGDCVVAVDGLPMSSPDQVLRAYSRLRSAHVVDVRLRRGGKPLDMRYYLE